MIDWRRFFERLGVEVLGFFVDDVPCILGLHDHDELGYCRNPDCDQSR